MLFCPNGTHWSDVWTDNGVNRCFYDSVTSASTFFVSTLMVVAHCSRHRIRHNDEDDETEWKNTKKMNSGKGKKDKRQREKEKKERQKREKEKREKKEREEKRREKLLKTLPGSCVHSLQCVVICLMALESLIHMILQDVFIQVDGLHGFHVMTMAFLGCSYILALFMLRHERKAVVALEGSHRWLGGASIAVWVVGVVRESCAAVSRRSSLLWWWDWQSVPDLADLGFWLFRITCCVFLLVTSIWVKVRVKVKAKPVSQDEETVQLHDFADDEQVPQTGKAKKKSKKKTKSTWSDIGSKIRIMAPMVWPRGSRSLQAVVFVCVVLLVAGRVVNVFVPIYSKKIVNSLTDEHGPLRFPWQLIIVYCTLLYLKGAGSGGMLHQLRGALWIKVQQYTSLRMNVRLFSHLHSLSLNWHLQRKTGEVLRVVEQGTTSMNTVLNQALFQIFPALVDSLIAVVYFVTVFNYLFGLIILTCMLLYIVLTGVVMEWRTKFRREMRDKDKEAKAKAVDSLLNFETVKYYGATEYEIDHYRSALVDYQRAEWKSFGFLFVWQAIQNTVTVVGYLAGLLLCAWAVVSSVRGVTLTVGDYVLMGSYLGQLFGPLNALGSYYKILQRSFIDMENMFELLEMEQDVEDDPGAKELMITEGKVEFKNVNFYYEPSRPILNDISFTVSPGETVALVGHTGSGKSTIIRLLFRFYDVDSGAILIDGQDISKVTQNSLRSKIGVVPQDTVLFNQDIQYNIQYGRFNASPADIEASAAAADIHDRILKFPSQYDTVVGERGLKLSGGEKQRVAIARTLLKAPAIVLLDEATSALDTKTERNIQTSLDRVCEGRTTIVIAHRLSTVVHADQILVMHEGHIVERGTHDELLAKRGHYAEMWRHQLRGHGHQDSSASPRSGTSDDEDDDNDAPPTCDVRFRLAKLPSFTLSTQSNNDVSV